MIGISFIIPYYKLDRELLVRAVDSILNAGLACDYEIIVVDDGTPDSQAAKWLDGRSDRLRYVWQENGGLSAARNTGIGMAQKEYIQFLDGDDYLFADGLRRVVELIEAERPDVAVFRRCRKVHDKGIQEVKSGRLKTRQFANGIEYMAQRSLFAGVWSYTFRRDILGDVRFLPGIYHEDEDFTPRLMANSGRLIETNIIVYAYYQRSESIVNSLDYAHVKKRFKDMFLIMDQLSEQEKAADTELCRYAFRRRKNQFALSVIYEAMRLLPDMDAVRMVLCDVRLRDCWPLPDEHYTWRYRLFRRLTDKLWKMNLLQRLIKLKK